MSSTGYDELWEASAGTEVARDVVRVSGPDAEPYLQGQLSQDIARLQPGTAAWALLLQPQGKLVALLRCYRLAPDDFLLYGDRGVGDAVVERLLRFRLRTKADVDKLPWRCIAVRGAEAKARAAASGGGNGEGAVVPFKWGPLAGYDIVGPEAVLPAGTTEASEASYEAARIEAGFPRHGAELDERTIPAEAGIVGEAVSFTKGCYTGQELVARIDSRGSNVPRRLYGLLLTGPCIAGALLASPIRKNAGRLTSVALSPSLGWVALGYVSRDNGPGDVLEVVDGEVADGEVADGEHDFRASWRGGPVTAEVRPLPLRGG